MLSLLKKQQRNEWNVVAKGHVKYEKNKQCRYDLPRLQRDVCLLFLF